MTTFVPNATINSQAITGPNGNIYLYTRVTDNGLVGTNVPTIVFITGEPGDTLFADQYALTSGTVAWGSAPYTTYTITTPVYNTAGAIYGLMDTLYAAGYRIVEIAWQHNNTPLFGNAIVGNPGGNNPLLLAVNAYYYTQGALNAMFSGVSTANRYVIGHSYGAAQCACIEIPQYHVPINRSVAMCPVGVDFYAFANTEHDGYTPTCNNGLTTTGGTWNAAAVYNGGHGAGLMYTAQAGNGHWAAGSIVGPTGTGGNPMTALQLYTQADNFNYPLGANYMVQVAEFMFTGNTTTNIRDLMRTNPEYYAPILYANSLNGMFVNSGAASLAPTGHNMYVMGADREAGYNIVTEYVNWRATWGGTGPTFYNAAGYDHSIGYWPALPFDAANAFIKYGSPATWTAGDIDPSLALSNNNLTVTAGAQNWASARATYPKSSGTGTHTFKITAGGGYSYLSRVQVGLAPSTIVLNDYLPSLACLAFDAQTPNTSNSIGVGAVTGNNPPTGMGSPGDYITVVWNSNTGDVSYGFNGGTPVLAATGILPAFPVYIIVGMHGSSQTQTIDPAGW